MRLLTTKIYRAYPELDKYDDEVCKRYIKRAKRLQNAWKFWVLMLVALPLSLVVWFGVMYGTVYVLNEYFYNISQAPETFIMLVIGTGIAWMPAFTALLIRDRWLHRCVRKQLVGVQCPPCGYSLIGLTIDTPNTPSVHCPECGQVTLLSNLGLTEADIDPTLIVEQA
tara:strand:- start:122577 stop:123080 length:504 start_codon:yes stop_codon:yes gene_type:complete